jgi:SAM-dependent methyltransferase
MARNFYGILRISDDGSGNELIRTLEHGVIRHGEQYLASERRRWPTTYYGESTGVGMAILATRNAGPQRVGVVGLGTGTMAAYGRPGDYYRFYEINPLVAQLARSEFTYLSDSPARIDLALGDARLTLEQEAPQNFDVLVVDAFSGDAIPMHLLAREAFALYFRHLKPGGILAVHVSNRYLDLVPIVKLAADHYAKQARNVDSNEDPDKDVFAATWVLVSDQAKVFSADQLKGHADSIRVKQSIRPWTDDYSSIYPILR